MEINNAGLSAILSEFDKYLAGKVVVVAVGGTALTLLGKKASTKDVDFCFAQEKGLNAFVRVAERLGYSRKPVNRLEGKGITMDLYSGGYIFVVHLPEDYLQKAILIKEMGKLEIYALNPLDIIITKTARLSQRDEEDINAIILSYAIDQDELVERYISTMENSMARDAKENLLVLFSLLRSKLTIDKVALQKAERWANGGL